MRRLLSLFLLLAAFPALAAEPVAFHVVPGESSIKFTIKQDTATITGEFTQFTAQIAFSPDALEASQVAVEVNAGSVSVSDSEARNMLPTPEWLDITQFPKASFTTDSFKALGDKRFEAAGKLTLKGVTVPLTLTFTLLEFSPSSARIMGEATLKRRDFHIGWDDTKSVADEVKLSIAVKAVAQ